MKNSLELEEYLSNGVENIVKGILKASFKNPKASIFMAKYALAGKKARDKRQAAERAGEHIPPFLIASITDKCNLHCKGCYARANKSCTDYGGDGLLTDKEWGAVFTEAAEMGVGFILLAGGEPFMRKDVLTEAGCHGDILFPIFTNGTMIDRDYMKLLGKYRNLLPVISIEGDTGTTDKRRGDGVFNAVRDTMTNLKDGGIMFGAAVTVTKENMNEALSDEFLHRLKDYGAKAVVYVEYVPVDSNTAALAPDDSDRLKMSKRLDVLRTEVPEMVFISFPGDEKTSGGCLAAGRGFFHINPRGGAEPCPFSPYSDINVVETSLKEALNSKLFVRLRTDGSLSGDHIGGCVLFEQKDKVERLVKEKI